MALSFQKATETTAILSYSTSFNLHEGAYDKSYSGSIGGTSVNSSSGTVTVYSLSVGQANTITGSITCYYKYDTTSTVTNANGSTTTITTTHSTSTTSSVGSIIVYTHPGAFSMNASSDTNSSNNIIINVLTKSKIDSWIAHFQKAYHWKKQSANDYNIDLGVKINEPISAEWFNKCMVAMNKLGKDYKTDYKGGPNGDIITASIINQLNFTGT